MRPQTCSATSLDTHRRALSRRPGAFFLATWTFLRHDSRYTRLQPKTATTATARSAEENFGASRAAAGVDAVVSQLGRGGAPLRFPAVGRKSLSVRTLGALCLPQPFPRLGHLLIGTWRPPRLLPFLVHVSQPGHRLLVQPLHPPSGWRRVDHYIPEDAEGMPRPHHPRDLV